MQEPNDNHKSLVSSYYNISHHILIVHNQCFSLLPLYLPGNTLLKMKLRVSLLPESWRFCLSPCLLMGWRVTVRSPHATEKIIRSFGQKQIAQASLHPNKIVSIMSSPRHDTEPETDAMNWVKRRSVMVWSTSETSREYGCRASPAFTSASGRVTCSGNATHFIKCDYCTFKVM